MMFRNATRSLVRRTTPGAIGLGAIFASRRMAVASAHLDARLREDVDLPPLPECPASDIRARVTMMAWR